MALQSTNGMKGVIWQHVMHAKEKDMLNVRPVRERGEYLIGWDLVIHAKTVEVGGRSNAACVTEKVVHNKCTHKKHSIICVFLQPEPQMTISWLKSCHPPMQPAATIH